MKINPTLERKALFEMSSMTDLIFILLLFFILLSTLIVPNVNALKLLLPNSSTATKQENLRISVSINEKLEYFISKRGSGHPVPEDQIQQVLESFLAEEVNPIVILHTHKSVPIENVVKVMDVANRLKVKLVLATNPER